MPSNHHRICFVALEQLTMEAKTGGRRKKRRGQQHSMPATDQLVIVVETKMIDVGRARERVKNLFICGQLTRQGPSNKEKRERELLLEGLNRVASQRLPDEIVYSVFNTENMCCEPANPFITTASTAVASCRGSASSWFTKFLPVSCRNHPCTNLVHLPSAISRVAYTERDVGSLHPLLDFLVAVCACSPHNNNTNST